MWPRLLSPALFGQKRIFKVDRRSHISSWCYWQPIPELAPAVIVVHGLESSSRSRHVLSVVQKALAAGMNAIAVNLRTCDGDYTLSNSLYNCGMSADIKAVAQELAQRDGLHTIFFVGYSLGGNIVLKAAAEFGAEPPSYLAGACAISPAIDPAACVQRLESGVSRIYQANFLYSLTRRIKAKYKVNPGNIKLALLKQIKSIRDFDEYFTAPDAGYLNADDYYRRAGAVSLMQDISVPTLIIQAEDDPFIPASIFSTPGLNNPFISLYLSRHGGHCGFIQQVKEVPKMFDDFWAENRVIEFCNANSVRR